MRRLAGIGRGLRRVRHARAGLAGDADIGKNSYFRHFFGWYSKQFLVLPFAVAERFKKDEISPRKEQAVATGSFHDLTKELPARKYTDFMQNTGLTTYHPIRKEIYDQKPAEIDCRVSPYRPPAPDSFFARVKSHLSVGQKSYFAINIVDLYNSYKYAIVGEEFSGFPALGAFEAMACGCTVIGLASCYKGTGALPGVHFIAHDGSLDDVRTTLASRPTLPDAAACARLIEDMRPHATYIKWTQLLNSL